MKLIALEQAQIRVDGKIVTVDRNAVVDVNIKKKEVPEYFAVLEDTPVDFEKDGEQALLEKDWDFADAKKAVKQVYGKNLITKDKTKEQVVAKILDIRMRDVSIKPDPKVTA